MPRRGRRAAGARGDRDDHDGRLRGGRARPARARRSAAPSRRSSTSTRRPGCARDYGNRDPSTVPFGRRSRRGAGARRRARARARRARRVRGAGRRASSARGRPLPLRAAAACWRTTSSRTSTRAYAAHGADASPFELGRTELVHGERLRRRGACARRARGCAPRWSASRRSAQRRGRRAPARSCGRPAARSGAGTDAGHARADPAGARGRAGGRARGDQPRGRRGAVREPEDDRGAPHADLQEARRPLAHAAGARVVP